RLDSTKLDRKLQPPKCLPIRKLCYRTRMNVIVQLYKTLECFGVCISNNKLSAYNTLTQLKYLPGLSGIIAEINASRCSPNSARSATNRSLSKFILAPDVMATQHLPLRFFSAIYFFS